MALYVFNFKKIFESSDLIGFTIQIRELQIHRRTLLRVRRGERGRLRLQLSAWINRKNPAILNANSAIRTNIINSIPIASIERIAREQVLTLKQTGDFKTIRHSLDNLTIQGVEETSRVDQQGSGGQTKPALPDGL